MDRIGIITSVIVVILIIIILFGSMRQKRIKKIMEHFETQSGLEYGPYPIDNELEMDGLRYEWEDGKYEMEDGPNQMEVTPYEMEGGRDGKSGGRGEGSRGGPSGRPSGRPSGGLGGPGGRPTGRGAIGSRGVGPVVSQRVHPVRQRVHRPDNRFRDHRVFRGNWGNWGGWWNGWWPFWLRYNYWWPSYDCVDYATNQCLGASDYSTCFNSEYRNCAWGNPQIPGPIF